MTDQASPEQPEAPPDGDAPDPRMVRADLVTAAVLVVLGVVILYASWTMPRLEMRRIHPLTVPGLVPGMLSVALIACGALLGLRAWRTPAPEGWRALGAALTSEGTRRALTVAVLVLVYTLGLIGLMPFWAATAIFVFAFVIVFEVWLGEPRRSFLKSAPWALGLAVVTAAAVTIVFERAFLVRLP